MDVVDKVYDNFSIKKHGTATLVAPPQLPLRVEGGTLSPVQMWATPMPQLLKGPAPIWTNFTNAP